uniref:Peptidase M24 domain-containing protein n=1 Tax=Astatotilapia calliptera TaxID=8154 RepID=A0AAX7V2Q8_ASTCA
SFCPFRPVYWLGNDTLRVFSGLKAKDSVMPKSVVVLQGGEKESFFHRAFGVTEAHCLGAIDVDSFLFVPKLPESYAAWIGKEKYAVDEVYFTCKSVSVGSTVQLIVIYVLLLVVFLMYALFIPTSVINPSVIYYGHPGAPNDRTITNGDMCLFDMGGECYCCPQTSPAILKSSHAVMAVIRPELVKIGILHGSVKDMMKVHLGSVIMPHGLGHLLGIDVEDVGGYPEPGSRNLLMGHLVQEWMVLMVEAGTYLISHLLDQAGPANPSLNCFISNQVLAHFCSFVGVCVQLFLKPFMSYSYLCNSLSGMLSK